MDIHTWISIHGYPYVYADIQNENIDISPFRYLYKSMDIHTRVTLPDQVADIIAPTPGLPHGRQIKTWKKLLISLQASNCEYQSELPM